MHRVIAALLWCVACRNAEGGLVTDQLNHVVDRNRPSLRACYEEALDQHPYEHEVRMEAIISIAAAGTVIDVELDEGGLPGMKKCIDTAIRGWKFPEAGAETRTQLPIVFQPEVKKVLPEGALVPGVQVR